MGFFDKVFKSERDIAKKEIVEVPWHPLTKMEQLDEITEESKEKTVGIFKHSTRCGISRMVLGNFEKDFDLPKEGSYKLYFLDLLANREISNEIAARFGVQHESPQMLILRDGKVVKHESHHSVQPQTLKEFV